MLKSNGYLPLYLYEPWRYSRLRRGPFAFALLIIGLVGFTLWPEPKPHEASITITMESSEGMLSSSGRVQTSFSEIRNYENSLPQHDLDVTSGNGFNGRVFMSWNEIWGLGLNNQLDDRLLLSHLAFLSNRSYVFNDVMFGPDWDKGKWYPLNTFISGPTAGGQIPSFLDAVSAPRSISRDFWQKACPIEKRTVLSVAQVNNELGITDSSTGIDILEKWARKLRDMQQECVEVESTSSHIFDFNLFGDVRLLSLYPSLCTSPIMSGFRFSNAVLGAVERNTPLITGSSPPSFPSPSPKTNAYTKTLAIHLRRDDFQDHCTQLARFGTGYNGWNLLPRLPDKYRRPDMDLLNPQNQAHLREFMSHCWPDIDKIVKQVRKVKKQYESSKLGVLDTVYILTNGDREWVAHLKDSLLKARLGFERVSSSLDINLITPPEKRAAQAVDMEMGVRSAVLIGNGFSSMTANMVLLRLLRGRSAETCRFW